MTADELCDRLVQDCEQSRDVVRDLLAALADLACTELAAGRPVTIPGLVSIRPMTRQGTAPEHRASWHADERIRAALRTNAVEQGGVGAEAKRPGERKGWTPAANLAGEPISRSPRK